jgi:hypothetical protein
MADDIEVHFDPRDGRLWLICGDEAFTRVLNAALNEANIAEFEIEWVPDAVQSLEVYKSPSPQPPAGMSDRVMLVGCGLIGFVILFLMVIGVGALAGWIR